MLGAFFRATGGAMIRVLACIALLVSLSARDLALADAFPTKPIRLIVGGGAGSTGDVRSRWVAQRMATVLGQPVVVENRAGAGGLIASEMVAKSAADGYTLLLVTMATLVAPDIYPNAGFDPLLDFAPISRISKGYGVLTVHPSLPVNSVADLIRLARERPGKLNYGSTGIGAPPWMMAEQFKRQARVEVTHVPYKGGGELLADLMAGRIDYWLEGALIQLPHIQAGRLRALAVTSPQRLSFLPDVPTLREAGLPDYDVQGWTGLAAPARTPRSVIDTLNAAMVKVLSTREAIDWLADQGNEPAAESPAEFAAFLKAEQRKWSPIVREANVKAQL
jgi:tripartite-type tricarboxylate transporter receptor subunit TctC